MTTEEKTTRFSYLGLRSPSPCRAPRAALWLAGNLLGILALTIIFSAPLTLAAPRNQSALSTLSVNVANDSIEVQLRRPVNAVRRVQLWKVNPYGGRTLYGTFKVPRSLRAVSLRPRPQAGTYVVRVVSRNGKQKGRFSKKFEVAELKDLPLPLEPTPEPTPDQPDPASPPPDQNPPNANDPMPIPPDESTPAPEPTPLTPPSDPPAGPSVPMCDSVTYNFAAYVPDVTGDDSITYFFEEPVPCGQFVDGSWWVVGPVRISRITPDHYALVPSNAATYSTALRTALQAHLNFHVGDPLCAHEPESPNCITAEQATTISDFYISFYGIPLNKKDLPLYRNGFSLDVEPDKNSYDSRMQFYQSPPPLPQYDVHGDLIPNSPPSLEIVPPPDSVISVVKSVSRNDIQWGEGWGMCNKKTLGNDPKGGGLNRGCLSSLAILTVVPEAPPALAFRPPYYKLPIPKLGLPSNGAAYYTFDDLDLTKLPIIDTQAFTASAPSQEQVLNSFGGAWMFLFNSAADNSFQQAASNFRSMNGSTTMYYHSSISNAINAAMIRTMHPDRETAAGKAIISQVTQRGIDYYYGLVGGKTYGGGTGFNLGFKSAILYAGHLLNDSRILDVGTDYAVPPGTPTAPNGRPAGRYFAEDSQTYFGEPHNGNPVALWGNIEGYLTPMTTEAVNALTDEGQPITALYDDLPQAPAGGGYGGFPKYYLEPYVTLACGAGGNRTISDPLGERDGGYWIDLNTTQRPIVGLDGNGSPIYSCPRMHRVKDVLDGLAPAGASYYQSCCSSAPMVGSYVVATLLGVREEWAHEPFFEYVKRWASPPYSAVGTLSGGYSDPYLAAVYWSLIYSP